MKNRTKLFLENFIVYGFGGAINRVIPFVILPILTKIYPDPSYIGYNDSVNMLVSFASQVAILGICDAAYRYYFDKNDGVNRKQITSTSLAVISITAFFVCSIMLLLNRQLASLFFASEQRSDLVLIGVVTTYTTCLSAIISTPTRMKNKRKTYVLINGISSIICYGAVFPLLKLGMFIKAMPLVMMASQIVALILFYFNNRSEFSIKYVSKELIWKLISLGAPATPSFVFYWVLSSAQRVLITNILGLQATGVYSVGAKLSSISQLIYSAFSAGWQYFAFSTMNDSDHTALISKVFDYLAGVSFTSTCLLIPVSKSIFKLLFSAEYAEGAVIMPALFLAPLVQMLYQTIGSQFWVIKKTTIGPKCLFAGAVVSIGLCYWLLPEIGIRGAAISGVTGFTIATGLSLYILVKKNLIIVRKRTVIAALLTYTSIACFMGDLNSAVYTIVALGAFTVNVFMYRNDLRKVLYQICIALKDKETHEKN